MTCVVVLITTLKFVIILICIMLIKKKVLVTINWERKKEKEKERERDRERCQTEPGQPEPNRRNRPCCYLRFQTPNHQIRVPIGSSWAIGHPCIIFTAGKESESRWSKPWGTTEPPPHFTVIISVFGHDIG